MATYAVGDIQGCYQTFEKLLKTIEFNPSIDTLWLAGDLINRGRDSVKVAQWVLQNQDSVRCVLGNHDLHFLAVEAGVQSIKSKDTLKRLLKSDCRQSFTEWLKQQPLVYSDSKLAFTMSHAGILPEWDLPLAHSLAEEVSEVVQSKECSQFFAAMYGNQPAKWSVDLNGFERLRFITNVFTRMRYLRADGSLDMTHKMSPTAKSKNLTPWFEVERERLKTTLLFGHWASLQGHCSAESVYALDTGCVWGGQLSALRLEDKSWHRVDSIE